MAYKNFPRPDASLGLTDAALLLTGEIAAQTKGGPGVEPQTGAMFDAVLRDGSAPIRQLLVDAAESAITRRRKSTGAAVSLLRTALVHYFIEAYRERGDQFTDQHRLTADDWKEPVSILRDDFVAHKSDAIYSLDSDIEIGEAATPAKERMSGPELTMQLVKDRFPNGARVLDYGSSIPLGSLQLTHKDRFPISFKEVVFEPAGNGPLVPATANANGILAGPSIIKKVVAVDRVPVYYEDRQTWDSGNAEFALSGQRPSERNNPTYFEETRSLMSIKQKGFEGYEGDSGVIFHRGDLLKPEDFAEFNDKYPEPFDIIIVNYVTQELPPKDKIRLHAILSKILSENGLIIYEHQAYIQARYASEPTPVSNIRHFDSYHSNPWRSYMHVEDALYPGQRGVQEMMNSYDNRWWRKVRLSTGKLVVNGSPEPIIDLVINS